MMVSVLDQASHGDLPESVGVDHAGEPIVEIAENLIGDGVDIELGAGVSHLAAGLDGIDDLALDGLVAGGAWWNRFDRWSATRVSTPQSCTGLSVDVAAVTDGQGKDGEAVIVECADEAVITDPVAPQSRKITGEGLTVAAGVSGVG